MENKVTIIIISIAVILVFILAFTIKPKENEKKKVKEDLLGINYEIEGNETKLDKYETKNPLAAMYIKGYGSIIIELYNEIAPNTVSNFISLIKDGFYDKNTFHRLQKDFVLQGGDPIATGTGGPGYTIKGEFKNNDFDNDLKHEKGIVSMARSQDYDSAGSQFFIMLGKAESLDGDYAAFGKVIDGWDNIENIIENERIISPDQLETPLTIEKVLIDVKDNEIKKLEKASEEK